MKAQSKRFVNHKGKAYDMGVKEQRDDNIGFFDLVSFTNSLLVLLCFASK